LKSGVWSESSSSVKGKTIVDLMKNYFKKWQNSKKSKQVVEEKKRPNEIFDKNKIITEFEKLQVAAEDWLTITSPSLKNLDNYPAIVLHDYSQKKIPLNAQNFRINETFDESKTSDPNMPPSNLHFFFRMSDKNIYYSNNKKSIHVLWNLPMKKVVWVNPERKASSTCFEIIDTDNYQWKLCAQTKLIRLKWVCYINDVLWIDDEECKANTNQDIIIEDTKVIDPVILIPLPAKNCNENWNYNQQWRDWNCDCSEWKTQSPIDIRTNNITRS